MQHAAADQPVKKAVETVKMRDIKNDFASTTSIKASVPKTGETALSVEEEQARDQIASPFTQAELTIYWDEFADRLRNDSPHLYSTLKSSRPLLQAGWTIAFALSNKVLEDELNTRKTELMEFLRLRLNNFKIQLQTSISEVQVSHKPYTDKEKFALMAERNPDLRKLREELDLEIEY